MGAITFTSCARLAIDTRSELRSSEFSSEPTTTASVTEYSSSMMRGCCCHGPANRGSLSTPLNRDWYQTFHSSTLMPIVRPSVRPASTPSMIAATSAMYRSRPAPEARKLSTSPSVSS
jgi:hypothetical protein